MMRRAVPPTLLTAPELGATPSADAIIDNTAHRAFLFFWNESHPETGLTKDRAHSLIAAGPDSYIVASTASTGYALASLPIAVQHQWVNRAEAEKRARLTLHFLNTRLPHEHGFFYHFIHWQTGAREWKCELSSIDTALLVLGALACGVYFGGEVRRLADALYARVDWRWMQEGVAAGQKGQTFPTLSMGWKPETGFIDARWHGYNEAAYLYLLALGAPRYNLPSSAWEAWDVRPAREPLEGFPVFGGPGPLFFAQMTPGYFDLRGKRDRQNLDWWTNFANAHRANHAYCARKPDLYPRHREALWGITACDQPPARTGENHGYGAQEPQDGRNDGTVAPTAALAGLLFLPTIARATALDLYTEYRSKLWGRYGFSNAFNPLKNWYDEDVIGIDLGMMLLCVENVRTGLVWKLMNRHPMTNRALQAAGFVNRFR